MPVTDKDIAAIRLYEVHVSHVGSCYCAPLSFFDHLTGKCPHCGGVLVAGPDILPEEAAKMLMMLQARRVELGLKP